MKRCRPRFDQAKDRTSSTSAGEQASGRRLEAERSRSRSEGNNYDLFNASRCDPSITHRKRYFCLGEELQKSAHERWCYRTETAERYVEEEISGDWEKSPHWNWLKVWAINYLLVAGIWWRQVQLELRRRRSCLVPSAAVDRGTSRCVQFELFRIPLCEQRTCRYIRVTSTIFTSN